MSSKASSDSNYTSWSLEDARKVGSPTDIDSIEPVSPPSTTPSKKEAMASSLRRSPHFRPARRLRPGKDMRNQPISPQPDYRIKVISGGRLLIIPRKIWSFKTQEGKWRIRIAKNKLIRRDECGFGELAKSQRLKVTQKRFASHDDSDSLSEATVGQQAIEDTVNRDKSGYAIYRLDVPKLHTVAESQVEPKI